MKTGGREKTNIQSGEHLGAARRWIQTNCGPRGSIVTWSSEESIGELTVNQVEGLAQKVKEAATREVASKIRLLFRRAERIHGFVKQQGIHGMTDAQQSCEFDCLCLLESLERLTESLENKC